MASGDNLAIFTATANVPPATNYATLDTRNNHPVLDFDASTDESAVFEGVLPDNYAGGGLTIGLFWGASSATSGNCIWDVAIERIQLDTLDIDSDSFAAVNSVTDAAPATSGFITEASVTFTDGADMDSLSAGEPFRLKVTRDADNASDTMTSDAELLRVVVTET